MKLNHLYAKNCGVYEDVHINMCDLSMASIIGKVADSNKSNTAGKSTIFRIIYYALTGKDYTGEPATSLIREGENSLRIILEFEFNGYEYIVKRTRDMNGRATAELLEQGELVSEGTTNVNDELELLFNMKHYVFGATVFFIQGALDSFTTLIPSERKKHLASILDIGEWDRFQKKSREKVKELDRAIGKLNMEISHHSFTDLEFDYTGAIDEKKEKVSNSEKRLAKLKGKLEYIKLELENLDKKRVEHETLKENFQIIDDPLSDRQRSQQQCSSAKRTYNEAKEALSSYQDKEKDRADLFKKEYGKLSIVRKIGSLNKNIIKIDIEIKNKQRVIEALHVAAESGHVKPKCPVCQMHLIDGKRFLRNRQVEKIALEESRVINEEELKTFKSLELEKEMLATNIDEWKIHVTHYKGLYKLAKEDFDANDKRLKKWRERQLEVSKKLIETRVHEGGYRTMQASRVTTQEIVDMAMSKHTDLLVKLTMLREKHKVVQEKKQIIKKLEEEKTALSKELDEWAHVDKMFSRKSGVPVDIIEKAIKQIEHDANEFLSEYEADFSLTLDTIKYTAKGDPVDTLDINIHTHTGSARKYSVLCGAEKAQVNIALRVALSILLCDRYDVSIESLFIDEALSAFDDFNKDVTLKIFKLLSNRFRQIFVISHNSSIRDILPQSIVVTKEGNASKVEIFS